MNRRDFMQAAMAGMAGMATMSRIRRACASPNDRIQLGCIGLGGMGRSDLKDFLGQPDVDVVALCDVDRSHLDQAAAMVKEQAGKQPDCYRHFHDLLSRKDIDAVLIATPDHWHGALTMLACQAGKDVYVEKPLVHNVREGRLAVETAKKHGRITQLGTQVHATDNYHKVAEIVQSGVLGPITQVRVWIAGNAAPEGIGRPEDGPVPEELDYDLWLGPAPMRPYNPVRVHFSWRYFWDTGCGSLGDFGCHIIDLMTWGMNPGPPLRVTSMGGRYLLDDIAETPDTQDVVWEFAPPKGQSNPFQLVWSHTSCNSHSIEGRSPGIKFCGTEGTLVAGYTSLQHFDRKGELIQEFNDVENSVGLAGGKHKREFLDSIRSRTQCSCDIEYAHRLTTLPLIGNIANRVGRRLEWDGEREQFKHDTEANQLLTRRYRKGYDLASLGIKEVKAKLRAPQGANRWPAYSFGS
jgi:predicted dehydrogenase